MLLPLKSEFIQKIYNNKKRHLGKNPQIVNTGQLPINDGQLLTRDERGIVFGVWRVFNVAKFICNDLLTKMFLETFLCSVHFIHFFFLFFLRKTRD